MQEMYGSDFQWKRQVLGKEVGVSSTGSGARLRSKSKGLQTSLMSLFLPCW